MTPAPLLVNIELINTGAELLLGRVLNTHQQWICRQLADRGYEVSRQCCVSDDAGAIQTAVKEALARADLIITTGGLGPTSDDRTRDMIAQLLGRKLIPDAAILAHIESFFSARKRPMPVSTKVQAMIPEGARILHNAHGTAPGLAIKVEPRGQWLVLLPGPPRELRPMFLESVVPLIEQEFPPASGFVCRTFKVAGLGESVVEEKVAGPLESLVGEGLELAYCARVGEVDLRLAARGARAPEILDAAERIVRRLLGQTIFGTGDDTLESAVVRLLTDRKKTVAVAESCTGGYLANRLTNVPGASAVFLGGVVTYSNQAKRDLLGVRAETLDKHGAVSEPVAREMAEGARRALHADFALSVTGIAGPGGGTEAKPVGTAYIGMATEEGTDVQYQYTPVDRETFKFVISQRALDLLRRKLDG